MNIPSEYSSSQEFWRRLVQMATRLLSQVKFPEHRYDDDLDALAEDIVQTALTRILEKEESGEPIRNWPSFCYGVMRNVMFEERRAVWIPYEAGWQKVSEAHSEDGQMPLILEDMVADPSPRVDQQMEQEEEERELEHKRQKVKQAIDEHLWQIIDEEVVIISDNPRFRDFVELCWLSGYSVNAAWEAVKSSNPGASRWTYYRRLKTLSLAVMKRWVSLGVEVKGGI
jgi:DNA-directed RNA polymerase specialized sigma24 family protein